MKLNANGLSIEVEDSGADGSQADRPVVLLIMGLGMQLVAWPPALVQSLVDAGYRVIRHDNRDIGLSQHLDELGTPRMLWTFVRRRLGLVVHTAYTLDDMARDSLGVLEALQISKAHIVGVSMGGMIAQRVALAAPARVLSLTSIMSTSGARGLPEPRMEVVRGLLGRPRSNALPDLLTHYLKLYRLIGSPAFPYEDEGLQERILAGLQRSYHPAGTLRQMVAIAADSTRASSLAAIRCPTLVIHGTADPLVPVAAGKDTARRIPGARLHLIEGMGHDLPPGVVERVLEPLIPHLRAA